MKNFVLCKLSRDIKGCSNVRLSCEHFMVKLFIWHKKKQKVPCETTLDSTRKKNFSLAEENLIFAEDFYENKSLTDFFLVAQ